GGQVPNPAQRLAQQGQFRGDQRVEFEAPLTGHRPDPDDLALFFDIGEPDNPIEVNDRSGLREPKIHHRHEALSAGQHPRLAVIALEDRQRLINRSGGVVFEFGRLHAVPPAPDGKVRVRLFGWFGNEFRLKTEPRPYSHQGRTGWLRSRALPISASPLATSQRARGSTRRWSAAGIWRRCGTGTWPFSMPPGLA